MVWELVKLYRSGYSLVITLVAFYITFKLLNSICINEILSNLSDYIDDEKGDVIRDRDEQINKIYMYFGFLCGTVTLGTIFMH